MPLVSPIVQFLVDHNPEVLVDVEDLRLDAGPVSTGSLDNAAVRQLVRAHYAKGQEHLGGFIKWLVRSRGDNEAHAKSTASLVWNALCMTYNKAAEKSEPTRLLDANDETYSYGTKLSIRGALRKWAQYAKDTELYDALLVSGARKNIRKEPAYILNALTKTPPYSDAEYKRVCKALEEYRGSPLAPWGYPLMRILLVYGAPIGLLKDTTKGEIVGALRSGTFTLKRKKRVKLFLVEPIREPLEILAGFEWEWGTIAQLVGPRNCAYYHPYATFARQVYQRAKVPFSKQWQYRMRLTAAWRYYKKTRSLVGTVQILDTSDLHGAYNLITFLQKYEAQEKAARAAARLDEEA